MMYLSWYFDNFMLEMESYQGTALNYFYLGSIKKAKFYHDRAIRGKSENENSLVKKTAIQIIKANKDRSISDKILAGKGAAGFDRIPSPSGFDRPPASNNQINLLPHFTEAECFSSS